jgi:hypothetical protein
MNRRDPRACERTPSSCQNAPRQSIPIEYRRFARTAPTHEWQRLSRFVRLRDLPLQRRCNQSLHARAQQSLNHRSRGRMMRIFFVHQCVQPRHIDKNFTACHTGWCQCAYWSMCRPPRQEQRHRGSIADHRAARLHALILARDRVARPAYRSSR